MVREDLLGGIKSAINRGESLKQAMFSLYNAGYKKQDIEEAAKAYQLEIFQQRTQPTYQAQPLTPAQPKTAFPPALKQPAPTSKPLMPSQITRPMQPSQTTPPVFQKPPIQANKPIQKISNYGYPLDKKKKILFVVLLMVLVLLLGGIVCLFLFKESVLDFLVKVFP